MDKAKKPPRSGAELTSLALIAGVSPPTASRSAFGMRCSFLTAINGQAAMAIGALPFFGLSEDRYSSIRSAQNCISSMRSGRRSSRS